MRKIEVSSAASALASVLNSKRKTKKKERKKEIYYKNRPQNRLNLNQCYVLVGWAGGSVIIMQRSYWRARFALCFRLAIFSARLNTRQKKEGKNGAFSEGKRTFNKLVGRQVKAIDRREHRMTHKSCFLHSPYFCLLFCFHINLKRKVIWRLKVQWESENELCPIIWQVWKSWNCTQIKSRIIAFLSDTNTKADLTRRHTSWLIIYLHTVFS